MKTSKLRVAGVTLLLLVVLGGTALQILGPGLVSTRPAPPPHRATTPQGVAITVSEGSAVLFHLKTIAPLAAMAAVGVLCLVSARRHETTGIQPEH